MKNLAMAVALALQGAPRVVSMANHSAFDPKLLLDSTTTQAGSLARTPVPADTHLAVIDSVDMSSGTGKDSKPWMRLDVVYSIDSPAVKSALGRDKVLLTQGIMLDRTPEGGLDYSKGRNVTLNRLRDATGLNQEGQPFAPRMLQGKPVKIVVTHTPSTSPAAQPGDVWENVVAFVKA